MAGPLFGKSLPEETALSDKDPLAMAEEKGLGREKALEEIRSAAIKFSKKRIESMVGRDELIVQAVSSLDELNETINLLSNRLREWYGIHAPELVDGLSSPEQFISAAEGKEGESEMGVELKKGDFKVIEGHAESLKALIEQRRRAEAYLETLTGELAPNLRELAGANLAARLIAKAGSLEKLARQPASTIQVYGAEKALFKHMIKGTPCPKHGIIFQHPAVMGSKRSLRGKTARALAGKLAISARIDFYSQEFNPEVVEDFEERLSEIKGEKE